jgi:hypothetical protein
VETIEGLVELPGAVLREVDQLHVSGTRADHVVVRHGARRNHVTDDLEDERRVHAFALDGDLDRTALRPAQQRHRLLDRELQGIGVRLLALVTHVGDHVSRPDAQAGGRRVVDGGDDHQGVVLSPLGDDDAQAEELSALLLAHVPVLLLVEEVRMGIECADHSPDAVVDQLLRGDGLDVAVLEELQEPRISVHPALDLVGARGPGAEGAAQESSGEDHGEADDGSGAGSAQGDLRKKGREGGL